MSQEIAIEETIADKDFYLLSRIDRSIADNLRDIEKSFNEDAGIVTDFIVFITKNLHKDIFGFTSFTLNDFCKATGRNKQELCEKHPYFVSNPKATPPEYFGHTFSTNFDYALFNMLHKNIIFAKSYDYTSDGKEISLKNFSILKDIKLNVDRNSNAVKLYDIRISDEMLEGFLQRYYTIETTGYKEVGKGRGGDGRKRLYIFLYKTRHILLSQNKHLTKFPLDYLCSIAGVSVKEPKNRKTSLKRLLVAMQENGKLPFKYTFVQGDKSNKYQEDYWVQLDYKTNSKLGNLLEKKGDHVFYHALVTNLQHLFSSTHSHVVIAGEKDTFQRWMTNNSVDLVEKANVLCSSWYKAYNVKITIDQAKRMIRNKFLENE